MKKVLVIGSGGLAREFAYFFSDQVEVVGFSGLDPSDHKNFKMPGEFFTNDVTSEEVGTDKAVIAIGTPAVKKKLYADFKSRGFSFPNFIHSSSIVSESTNLNEGVVISPHCIISTSVTIGVCAYVNFQCGIGHDSEVCDYVQINPGSQIGGNVRIGEATLVGANVCILQGTKIGAMVTMGSGSASHASVPESATMLGSPAIRMRIFEKNKEN